MLDPANFDAVLFDMNGTFMFGHDRLGEDEDYHATYRSLGGEQLDAATVHGAVVAAVRDLTEKYYDTRWFDCFPSVADTLSTMPFSAHLPPAERELICDTIVVHELGDIDDDHAAGIRNIAASHPLGVVSNIWSRKQRWLDRFSERGVLDTFGPIVFSSDGPYIKPSPGLFSQALSALGTATTRTLFVGDDPICDVAGEQAVGMPAVLVGNADSSGIGLDREMPHLPALADLF